MACVQKEARTVVWDLDSACPQKTRRQQCLRTPKLDQEERTMPCSSGISTWPTIVSKPLCECRACFRVGKLRGLIARAVARVAAASSIECCNCSSPMPKPVQVSLDGCEHVFCRSCVAVAVRVHVAVGSLPSCLIPGCAGAWADSIISRITTCELNMCTSMILDTPLASDIVFCPRCESIGVDTPVLALSSERSLSCCYECHWVFCSTCRSPRHEEEECVSDASRAARMLRRRPPLPLAQQQEASVLVQEASARVTAESLTLDVRAGFDLFQEKFLKHHEAAILKGLEGAFRPPIELQPAPVADSVRQCIMQVIASEKGFVRVRPAFHGTDVENHPSIFSRGLLVPGEGNELKVVHGAAHGEGIYTANVDAAWLSRSFCAEPCLLVCAVLQLGCVRFAGDAMVVSNASHVAPLFVATGLAFQEACLPPLPSKLIVSARKVKRAKYLARYSKNAGG